MIAEIHFRKVNLLNIEKARIKNFQKRLYG